MATKGLCKNGFNQARSCSNGQDADDDSDDDWGGWKAPVEVVEVEDETEEENEYYERWDEDVEEEAEEEEEEEGDDGVEVEEVDAEEDEAQAEAARVAALFAETGDVELLDGLCNSLDDQFANRADVCPIHMTHWVEKKTQHEQTDTVLKRRRGTSSRAGRVSSVNGLHD